MEGRNQRSFVQGFNIVESKKKEENYNFLSKDPQITLFRNIQKKYLNFSVDPTFVDFDSDVSFGSESSVNLPFIADMINKIQIEITLPEVSLKRQVTTNSQDILNYNNAVSEYEKVKAFSAINRSAFIGMNEIFLAENISNSAFIIQKVNSIFNIPANATKINDFKAVLLSEPNYYQYSAISLQDVFSAIDVQEKKNIFYQAGIIAMKKLQITQKKYLDKVNRLKDILDDNSNKNLKFAWVEKIGHALIKDVEILINGKSFEKQTGEWIDIASQFEKKKLVLNDLIGNIPVLTSFDRNTKPEKKILVPLRFWFCENSYSSLPLFALTSNTVTLKVTFRKIEEVSYVENLSIFLGIGKDNISLADVPEVMKLNIKARLIVDYVYLSLKEKQYLFGSLDKIEYGIKTIQQIDFKNITNPQTSIDLIPFSGIVTSIIWTIQKASKFLNNEGIKKTEILSFSENDVNPMDTASLKMNNFFRFPLLSSTYYNYVTPYEYKKSSPEAGVNLVSFTISSINNALSFTGHIVIGNNIKNVSLNINFKEDLITKGKLKEPYIIKIYASKINIFKIANGFPTLCFN